MIGLVIIFIVVGVAGFLFMLRLTSKSKSMPIQGANEEFNFIISLISKAANIHILDRAKNQINSFMYRYRHQISVRELSWYEDRMHTALRMKFVEFARPDAILKERSFSGGNHIESAKHTEQAGNDLRPDNNRDKNREKSMSLDKSVNRDNAMNRDNTANRDTVNSQDVNNSDDMSGVPIEVEKKHPRKK